MIGETETDGRQQVKARQKLNSAAILGSVSMAGVLGCVSNSWLVFIVAALILIGLSCHNGDIRPGKRG
jgi:hypothetical protein